MSIPRNAGAGKMLLLPVLALAVLLSACSLAPRYERPGQDLPAQWKNTRLETTHKDKDWWNR